MTTNNELQVFTFEETKIRTVCVDNEPWFVAADICRVLEIGNPSDALYRLDADERTLVSIEGGSNGLPVNAVNEAGLYSLILSSRKPQAKAFRRWVTHEVIPAIRKHGVYAVESLLENPDALITALTAFKQEKEKNQELLLENAIQKQRLAELQPKITYYDHILNSKSTVKVSMIAKDYGYSAKRFNKLLGSMGIQYRQGKDWLLYDKYASYGYTQSCSFPYYDSEGKQCSRTTMKWTASGRLFLYDKLKQDGILPLIERGSSSEGN